MDTAAEALTERPERSQAAFDRSDTAGAQAFASLNAGFFDDGIVLALDAGVMLERPVETFISHMHRKHSRFICAMPSFWGPAPTRL